MSDDQKVLEELYDLFELPKRRPLSVDAIRAAFRDMREPLYKLYSGSEYTGMSGIKRAAQNLSDHADSEHEHVIRLARENKRLEAALREIATEGGDNFDRMPESWYIGAFDRSRRAAAAALNKRGE